MSKVVEAGERYQQGLRAAFETHGFPLPVQKAIEESGHTLVLVWNRLTRENQYLPRLRITGNIESQVRENMQDGDIKEEDVFIDNGSPDGKKHIFVRDIMLAPMGAVMHVDDDIYDKYPLLDIRHSLIFFPQQYAFFMQYQEKVSWGSDITEPIMNDLAQLTEFVAHQRSSWIFSGPIFDLKSKSELAGTFTDFAQTEDLLTTWKDAMAKKIFGENTPAL